MTIVQIAVLAIIQGLTEFLPVSSSAHLILVSVFGGWPDQGLALDVAAHLGTLFAVIFYFRGELASILRAWTHPTGDAATQQARQLGKIILLASLPVILVGWLAYDLVASSLRNIGVIAGATLFFGVLLLLADRFGSRHRGIGQIGLKEGLIIGLAQALALIPGTSRSGVTIMMGRMLGFDAEASARFSFLLSIPVITVAGAHGIYRLATGGNGLTWLAFVLAVFLSALAGWVCIAAFLALLRKTGLLPFIVYRLALGLFLLYLLY